MSKVYVVSAVNGKNLLPAKEFGELHVILHGGESNVEAYNKLDSTLSQIKVDDFLLLIGHPLHIGVAVHLTCTNLLNPQFLIWDRTNYNYRIERITDGKRESTDATTGK
jgi:hypothetical protein